MSRNDEQLETWIQDHGDYLFRYALSRVAGDRELARDMVQETLLAAYKSLQSFDGRSSASTWLIGILRHKIADHFRHHVRSQQLHEDVQSDPTSDWFGSDGKWDHAPKAWKDNPETLHENADFRKVLQTCMGHLPGVQREVFILRELDGDDSASICKRLGISTSNLHVLMHRARMALRSCLQTHWFGERG
jgi:RNA polymerase sigma-70 factor (TIGR02943 family)